MLVNYRFLGWVVCILFILQAGAQPVGNNGTIVVVMPVKPSPRIAFAAGYLGRSLHKAGYDVSKTTSVQKVKKGQLAIVLKVNSGPANPGKEGYSILLEQNQPGSIVGGDESGLLYGCMELAETVDHVGKLPENFSRSDKPEMVRHFPGYLAQADAVQMVDKCLSAPDTIRFDIFDAISENSRRWRDTSHAKEVLGWKPTGSSDRFDPNTLAV